MANLTREEAEAMRIQAMMRGISAEELQTEVFDENDIIIVDEEPKKKVGKAKVEKKVTQPEPIKTLPAFEKLHVGNKKVTVYFNAHGIPYKEQTWSIPSRTVDYNIKLVTIPKRAADISDMINKKSDIERDRARNGEVRYIEVVSYQENISFRVRNVAYACIRNNCGKLTYKIYLPDGLNEHHVNEDKLRKDFENIIREIVSNSR